MKNSRIYRPISSLGILAVALAMSVAQDEPKTDGGTKQEPQIAEQKELFNSISLGYQSFFPRAGVMNQLGQYVNPATGLQLFDLKLVAPTYGVRPWANFNLRGLPGQSYVMDGAVVLGGGRLIGGFSHSDYSHTNSDWQPTMDGQYKTTQFVTRQRLAPNVGMFQTYREDDRKVGLVAPNANRDNINKTVGLGLQARALGGDVGVQFSDSHFIDRTGLLPETSRRNISGFYAANLIPGFNIEAGLNYAANIMSGRKDTAAHGVTINSILDPWPNTALQFNFSEETVNDQNVLNAYVKKRVVSSLKLMNRFPGGVSLQTGFTHRENQRLRADQTYVDVPKWDRWDGRLSGKLKSGARWTFRGFTETLTNAPVFTGADPTQLYWSDQSQAQFKLDGGNDKGTAYGSVSYRYRSNQPRSINIGQTNVTLGSSYIYSPQVLGFIEYSYDSFQVHSAIDLATADLGGYFPNSQTLSFGLDYTPHAEESLSASVIHYQDNNFNGNQIALQYKRQLAADRSLSLAISPWRYTDGLYKATDYNATFVSLKYSIKF